MPRSQTAPAPVQVWDRTLSCTNPRLHPPRMYPDLFYKQQYNGSEGTNVQENRIYINQKCQLLCMSCVPSHCASLHHEHSEGASDNASFFPLLPLLLLLLLLLLSAMHTAGGERTVHETSQKVHHTTTMHSTLTLSPEGTFIPPPCTVH